jgi:hypothetical protein
MYAGGIPALPGMRGWPEGTCAWLSSGESTGLSPSTPFASPDAGSGAFRQAWSYVREDDGDQLIALGSYLDEVLSFGLSYEGL